MKAGKANREANGIEGKRLAVLAGLILFIAAVMAFNGRWMGADFSALGRFFVYNFFYILLPGLLLLSLLRVSPENRASRWVTAWFMGFALLAIEYLISMKTGFHLLVRGAGPLLSLLAILHACRWFLDGRKHGDNRKGFFLRQLNVNPWFCVYFAVVLLLVMIHSQFGYPNPAGRSFIQVYQDDVWHMGNINALALSLPPLDPHVDGIIFSYHYFTELVYAICQNLFGIPADVLIFTCGPYLVAFLFGLSLYGLFQTFLKRRERAGLYGLISIFSGVTISAFMLGTLSSWGSWFYGHAFSNTNATGFGMSALMVFTIVVKGLLNRTDGKGAGGAIGRGGTMLSAAILIGLTTGFKGPYGLVGAGGLLIALAVDGISRRRISGAHLGLAAATTLSFLAIYLFVISGIQFASGLGGADSLSLSFTASVQGFALYKLLPVWITANPVAIVLLILIDSFVILAGFSLPWLYAACRRFRQVKTETGQRELAFLMMVPMVVLGFGAFFSLSQSGHSQVYFLFAAIPFAQVVVFRYFEDEAGRKSRLLFCLRGFFILGLAFGLLFNLYASVEKVREDIGRYGPAAPAEVVSLGESGISGGEYEALLWLREHTEAEDLCATNRHYLYREGEPAYRADDSRFFYDSAYSQRRYYLEGHSYSAATEEQVRALRAINDSLYAPENPSRAAQARAQGIKYLLMRKSADTPSTLEGDGITRCYSNEAVDIYRVD